MVDEDKNLVDRETEQGLFPRATPRPWRADRHDIVGGEGKNYVALVCIGGTRTGNANRDLILDAVNSYDSLRAEVADLRRRNETQEQSITHLQSQLRVMKEAIEAAQTWIEKFKTLDHNAFHAFNQGFEWEKCNERTCQKALALVDQLRSAITPKGSEK